MSDPQQSKFRYSTFGEPSATMPVQAVRSTASQILILAIGNPLRGDDGVGHAVLEALNREYSFPPEVSVLEDRVIDLVEAFDKHYQRVILVDAANMDRSPGEWERFTPRDMQWKRTDLAPLRTSHGIGLMETLALCEALGRLPQEIVIYGVQPLQLELPSRLSEPVQRAVPEICRAIMQELTNQI